MDRSKRARILLPLVLLLGLVLAALVGVLTLQPGLALSYFCLAPFVCFWLGRASFGLGRVVEVKL